MAALPHQVIESHPNYRQIRYNKARVGFVDSVTNKKLKGITDGLDQCFWPEYRLKVSPTTERDRLESEFTFGRQIHAYGPDGGQRRGSIIHRELKVHADMKRASDEEWTRYKQQCHEKELAEWTLMVLGQLEANGLHLMFSELCVGDRENGLATAIDMVCVDEENRWHLVELKTGYANVFTEHCSTLTRVDRVMGDCPLNQAKIQLAITRHLFDKTFPEVPIGGMHVLNVNRLGTWLYRMDDEPEQRRLVYESFLLWRNGLKSRKRVSRTPREKKASKVSGQSTGQRKTK